LFSDIASDDLFLVQKRISESEWRASEKAKDWAGKAVAEVLGYDLGNEAAKKQIRRLLATWIKSKALKVVDRKDAKRTPRKWIEVGEWVTD